MQLFDEINSEQIRKDNTPDWMPIAIRGCLGFSIFLTGMTLGYGLAFSHLIEAGGLQ